VLQHRSNTQYNKIQVFCKFVAGRNARIRKLMATSTNYYCRKVSIEMAYKRFSIID